MSEAVRRTARIVTCRCGEPVLTGLDANRCALTAVVDVFPLSNAGEVAALRDGRWTYSLRWRCLDRRNRWLIAGEPADEGTVLAQHRCGERVPQEWSRPIRPAHSRRTTHADF